ncbi:pilus assembly protein PilY [Psychrobacter sp. PSP]|uniref:pilus assembly protein PilY n=1 Tax=Psychrobacter sp. PSP TaxID=2734636 RepID=UPI0020960048|nr:pilus assembly protein PilY [Psychrobacter sp. PSP]
MKRLNTVSPISGKVGLPLKYLVVAMAAMVALPVAQADVAGKKIGDLEIYKAAEGGKTTITMMLDTSGSMTINQVDYACDLPSTVSFDRSMVGSEPSMTSPSYPRMYCEVKGEKRYFYRNYSGIFGNKWYICESSDGLGVTNRETCNTEIDKPSVKGYKSEVGGLLNTSTYYYKDVGGEKYYDRLTRLKDAIFTLMDSTQLDSNKVAIGIGQFSSQSGSNNVVEFNSNGTAKNADGSTGKILLPAALLDDVQRQNIRNVVAAAGGGNGTPTANAYAEVGAYMLGTKTSGTGSGFSKSYKDTKNSGNYISPLSNPSSCDGRGIYFLTDGAPNSSSNPLALMRIALKQNSFSLPSITLPSGSQDNNGMPEVGAFAKALRDSTVSPLGTDQEIYTAVVGFGADFNVNKEEDAAKPEAQRVIRSLPYTNPKTGVTTNRDFYNCENIVGKDDKATKDARNACNWGEKSHPSLPGVGGFGEGGFYSAQSTEDIIKSITNFVSDLNQTLPSTPSGTIIIPDDPYRADSQLAVAYYPTIQPKVADNAVIWEGNMKKYILNEGTLYGKSNTKLFKNIAGELNPAAQDLWSDTNYAGANDKVESGGFYSQLSTPATGVASVRTLYVEDWENSTSKKPVLKKVSVNAAGKVLVNNAALTNTSFVDTATYNEATLRKLLNFLGFANLPATTVNVKDMTLTSANATQPIKVLGATIHSTPASVSYSANLDEDGRVNTTRDDYVLFGSSEGGLHLVNADNASTSGNGGKEKFVIIPREMLIDPEKSAALVKDATKTSTGSPNFGIDAPWLVSADYKYDFEARRVNIDTTDNKGIYAYGGLRMGGEALYGLNLINNESPSMMFAITPATSGFNRMGQIWEKPTKAKIKMSTAASDKGTDVLVFGGGYDMCYEYEGFQLGVTNSELKECSGKTSVKGNAVYIINAKTGALIWSASSDSGATTSVPTMKNSIVAGVTTLDRDNDGFMDHIYFADLGGQVFRADFTNAGFVKPSTTATASSPETSFTNTRVTRVLQSAYTGSDTKYNHRFYERPVVSFYRNPVSSSLFALVNVISGDRSSPLSKIRDLSKSDRLYGIMDTDVTKADNIFYASNFTTASNANGQKIADLTANNSASSNLVELPSAIGTLSATGYTVAQKNTAISVLQGTTKNGWYIPLTNFDGYGNVRYTKGVGKSEVIDSFLYTTAYNPDMNYGTVDSCSAKITGGSERQLYCLPYGICTDDASKNGLGGFVRAGKGIQELTLGPRSSTLSNQRLLIGTRTLAERANDRVNFGSDTGKGIFDVISKPYGLNQNLSATDLVAGSGTAPDLIFNDRFTLQPKTWYEVD